MPNAAPASIRAVAFDLDGLMLNTEEVYSQTGTEILSRRGKRPAPDLFHRMMGLRAREALQVMIDVMDLSDTIDQLQSETDEIFGRIIETHLQPMPGLFDLLERIESQELPRSVATSSSRGYLEDLLGRFDLLERFDFTLTAEDVTHGKPHPEIYLTAAERMGVDPQNMLVLEDSEAGTRAAAAAGAHVVAVPHEHSARQDFTHAAAVAESLTDQVILRLL